MRRLETMTSHLTGHLTNEELERYRGRTLPPQQLLSANAHLHDCDSCHQRYDGDRRLGQAFTFAQSFKVTGVEESHLAFEQLAAYVDDELRGEEQFVVAAHLEECAECEAQVRELKPLRALISGNSYPALVLAGPSLAPVTQPTFFEKLRDAWQTPSYRVAAQVAGVLLVVALLGWVLTRSLGTDSPNQTRAPQPRQEQAQIKPEGAPSGVAPLPAAEQNQPLQPSPGEKASQPPAQPALANETTRESPESRSTILALQDGDLRLTLDGRGRVGGLDSLSPGYQRLVRTVLTTARVETPRMPWEGGGNGDKLMGGGSGHEVSFTLNSPVGKVVQTVRPTFRWTPLEGATSYVVTIRDSTTRTLVMSDSLSSAEWTVPNPLRHGVIYSWKVLAVKNGEEVVSPLPTAPDAQFKVLEEAQAEELEQAKQAHPRSRLLLGALYARAGLLDDAEREFRELVEKNPRSRLAQKLLRSVGNLKSRNR